MQTQSADTSPEMERVQIEMLRQVPISKHIAIVESWSTFIREVALQNIRRDNPDATDEEISLILVTRQYGQNFADSIRADLARRRQQCTIQE